MVFMVVQNSNILIKTQRDLIKMVLFGTSGACSDSTILIKSQRVFIKDVI